MGDNNLLFNESKSIDLGILYFDQGKYKLAIEEFNKVLYANPKNETVHVTLGHIYLRLKDFSQAIVHFNKVLELNPQSIEPHVGLGFCYVERGYIKEAMNKFNYALKLNLNNEHAHFGLGLCYYQKKEFDKAIEEFNQVLKINPQHNQAYHQLGLCYLQKKNFSQAIANFDLAKEKTHGLLKINLSSILTTYELGNIYLEKGDCATAVNYFQKILELCAQQDYAQQELLETYIFEAYLNIGRAYLLMEKFNLAIESLKKAMELRSQEERVNRFLHQAYLGAKEYDLAVDILSKSYAKSYELSICPQAGKIPEKIKIVRIANFYGSEVFSTEMNSIMLPPLALGNLVAYIRSQGFYIDQDDLHIKIHYNNYFDRNEERVDEMVFFDIPRVIKYAKGEDDSQIEEIMEKVSSKTNFQGYKIILFSLDSCSMNDSHAMFALCLARYLKEKYHPIIILGGLNYFVELMRKNGCDWSNINYVICNEGEEVVVDLLFSLLNNCPSLKGRVEENGRVIWSVEVPKPVRPDFDGLPLERYRYRGLKIDYCKDESLKDTIKKFNESRILLLPFRFIKGCTNKCIFCASSYGGLIHVVDPDIVTDWLQELQAKYNPTGYLFLNDTLNISKKYIDRLCDEIIKRKLKILWCDCVRADKLDKESIYKMREAGCIRLVFGMETASKRLLNYINKDIDLDQLEEALYWADRTGIWTGIELISGLPYEREEDVKETISFLKQNRDHIDALYYNAFNIKDTSLIQLYPEKYGITNIFELTNYEEGFFTFVKYGFDEINGLRWPEKVNQIISALNKIIENFGESPFPEHEYEHFLFFLYSNYADKRVIKNLFYSIGKQKMEHLNVLRRIKKSGAQDKESVGRTLIYG